ncbi:MAG: peptidoglycan recognition protein family protein [Clostridium sp.]
MSLENYLIDENMYYLKSYFTMTPSKIVIHNTGNDASAYAEADYMESNYQEVSFHIAIDDERALLTIPLGRNAWHCGNYYGNRNYLGVEICYSKSGGQRFIDAEERAVKEVADLCIKFGFNPDTDIKPHREFFNTNCPERTDMNSFISRVKQAMNVSVAPPVSYDKEYLNLKEFNETWRVYPTDVAPVVGNECGMLAPSRYGGLSYEIEGNPINDVYTITTQAFGTVNIYAPKDADSIFSSYPIYQ